MPIYIVHFLTREDNVWLNDHTPQVVIRREERRYIASHLFAASDAEAAYVLAMDMLPGMSDAHHDGPGHRTGLESLGLFDLDDIQVFGSLDAEVNGTYGIDAGVLFVDQLLRAEPRKKSELSLFVDSNS